MEKIFQKLKEVHPAPQIKYVFLALTDSLGHTGCLILLLFPSHKCVNSQIFGQIKTDQSFCRLLDKLKVSGLNKSCLVRDAVSYINLLKKICQVTAETTKKAEVTIATSCFVQTL